MYGFSRVYESWDLCWRINIWQSNSPHRIQQNLFSQTGAFFPFSLHWKFIVPNKSVSIKYKYSKANIWLAWQSSIVIPGDASWGELGSGLHRYIHSQARNFAPSTVAEMFVNESQIFSVFATKGWSLGYDTALFWDHCCPRISARYPQGDDPFIGLKSSTYVHITVAVHKHLSLIVCTALA
jgi:hypothetical protein